MGYPMQSLFPTGNNMFRYRPKGGAYRLHVSAAVPPPPLFVSAATSTDGTTVTITFSKEMADPSGKHAQFTVMVVGSADAVTAAVLNENTTKIDLALTAAATSGQTVTVAYTAGTVTSADTGILASFTAQEVTNNAAPPAAPYQEWTTYPDSPLLTADYPYQVVTSGNVYLACSPTPFFKSATYLVTASPSKFYRLMSGVWVNNSSPSANSPLDEISNIIQANNPVYTDNTLTAVVFAKTTP